MNRERREEREDGGKEDDGFRLWWIKYTGQSTNFTRKRRARWTHVSNKLVLQPDENLAQSESELLPPLRAHRFKHLRASERANHREHGLRVLLDRLETRLLYQRLDEDLASTAPPAVLDINKNTDESLAAVFIRERPEAFHEIPVGEPVGELAGREEVGGEREIERPERGS